MKWKSLALSALLLVSLAGAAPAGTMLALTYSDPFGNAATAVLCAADQGHGSFLVTTGMLTVASSADPAGTPPGSYSLAGGPGPTGGAGGSFAYDDLVFPASPSSYLDLDGLLFQTGGQFINIYGNGGSDYAFYSGANGGYDVQTIGGGTVTLTELAAAEPPSLALLATTGSKVVLGYRLKCGPAD